MLKDAAALTEWRKKQIQLGELYYMMINEQTITLHDKTMNFQYFTKGDKPQGGYTLIFGLHGGGGCPTPVNDQQFNNHLSLYNEFLPEGSIWFVPRSCEEAPDMWWKGYLPEFFQIVIKGFVLKDIVNPNKVFITGYSAGGDGIYHLGPMLADWLAGAAMMAGHPNGVQLFNVRNIAFSIQVGGRDDAYDRNILAREYIAKMNALEQRYGGFCAKYCKVHEQCEHWMKKADAYMFPQYFKEARNPYPNFITFKQHPRMKKQNFYYLQVDPQRHKELMVVKKTGNNFFIQSQIMPVTITINHLFIDYSQEVKVWHNGTLTVCKKPERKLDYIIKTIQKRLDPHYIFEDYLISVPKNARVPLEAMLQQQHIVPNQPQPQPLPLPENNPKQIVREKRRVQDKNQTCCALI